MKKLILLLTIVALATTIGCNKEEITPEPELKSGTIYCWADIWQLPDAEYDETMVALFPEWITPNYYIDGLNLNGADIEKMKITKSPIDPPSTKLKVWRIVEQYGSRELTGSEFFYVVKDPNNRYVLSETSYYNSSFVVAFLLQELERDNRPCTQTIWVEVHMKNGDIYNGMQIKLLWEAEDNSDPYGDPLPFKRD